MKNVVPQCPHPHFGPASLDFHLNRPVVSLIQLHIVAPGPSGWNCAPHLANARTAPDLGYYLSDVVLIIILTIIMLLPLLLLLHMFYSVIGIVLTLSCVMHRRGNKLPKVVTRQSRFAQDLNQQPLDRYFDSSRDQSSLSLQIIWQNFWHFLGFHRFHRPTLEQNVRL